MRTAFYLLIGLSLFTPFFLRANAHWYAEIKPGYYYFTDDSVREILGNGTFSIRGEAGCQFCGPVTFWIDGGYLSKSGTAIGSSNKCDLKMGSLTFGGKATFFLHPRFALYVGMGPRIFFIHIHDSSPFVMRNTNTTQLGGAFAAGFWIFPIDHLFLDLFLDYSYIKFMPSQNDISSLVYRINLSGLTAGLGLGVRF